MPYLLRRALPLVGLVLGCTEGSAPSPPLYHETTPVTPPTAPRPAGRVEGVEVHVSTDSMASRGEVRGVSEVVLDAVAKNSGAGSAAGGPPRVGAPVTPDQTFWFDTDPLANTPDANVAVSSTHVCVTNRGAFGCYTKAGTPVSPGLGLGVGQVSAFAFFTSPVTGIFPQPIADCSTDFAKDGRIVFDQVHGRFFMAFQSRELPSRLLIAVSQSENPSDGWFTYADNLSTLGTTGSDYQWIGITATHLLLSEKLATGCGMACNGVKSTCSGTTSYHLAYSIASMLTGQPYTRTMWKDDAADGAVPAISDSSTPNSFYVHHDDPSHVSVWAVDANNLLWQSGQVPIASGDSPIIAQQRLSTLPGYCGPTLKYTNIGSSPQNVEYRDGKLSWVANVGHVWSGVSTTSNAVHVGRMDVNSFFLPGHPIFTTFDEIFGRSSPSDPAGSLFDYGWPAVASNSNGDLVIGSIRSSCATFPELRASAVLAGQTAVSPSIGIVSSDATMSEWHMAGAAADPSTTGVYIGQIHTRSGATNIRVSKMLGTTMPDLVATRIDVPVGVAITRGVPFTVNVTLANQGDAPSNASVVYLRLSPDDVISVALIGGTTDPRVGVNGTAGLPPGGTVAVPVSVTIPTTLPAGFAYLGAQVDVSQLSAEYSEMNNMNPLLGSPHGNVLLLVH